MQQQNVCPKSNVPMSIRLSKIRDTKMAPVAELGNRRLKLCDRKDELRIGWVNVCFAAVQP
ncbi:hypothetical protein Pan44_07650 [Caulifigura coniformis]|uniref:Uncharacterized protein n=1 Tax=Caulifigura coniformis TaxID=2527983 RepID=A0A517S9G4_9PLAN|nr:hypothetical protein Pan44_07650 [Caulifigura coniformis]